MTKTITWQVNYNPNFIINTCKWCGHLSCVDVEHKWLANNVATLNKFVSQNTLEKGNK